jgi:hypothetical protein
VKSVKCIYLNHIRHLWYVPVDLRILINIFEWLSRCWYFKKHCSMYLGNYFRFSKVESLYKIAFSGICGSHIGGCEEFCVLEYNAV